MKYEILTIKSVKEENLELLEVLSLIISLNPAIKDYIFSITFFEGIPNEKFPNSFNEFIDEINNTDFPLLSDFKSVKEKISGMSQIFDLLLLIDTKNENFKKYSINEDKIMYNNVYLTIAYFDSGVWEISCKEEQLLYKLKEKFINSKIINRTL